MAGAPRHPPLGHGLARARRAVLAAFAVAGMVIGSWGARIPAVRRELELSEGALGTALLGSSVGAVLGAWLGGVAERRVGARAVIAWSWPVLGLALTAPGAVPSWAALTASLFVLGVAMGVLDVSMNAAAVRVEDAAGRPVLSGLHAGWSAGLLAGAAVGSAAVAVGLTPAAHLAGVGVAIAVAGVVVRPALPDDDVGVAGTAGAGRAVVAERPPGDRRALAAAAAICGCVFLAEGAAIDWSGVLVDDAFGGTPLQASLAVLGVSAGGLAGRLVADRAVAGLGAVLVVRRGALVAVGGLGAALLLAQPAATPVLLFLLGFGVAPAVPLAFGAAGRLRGSHGIAIATTAGYGSYLTGPVIIGWLGEAVGLRGALLVPLVLIAAVAVLAMTLEPGTRPRPDLAPPLGSAD